MRPIFPTRRLFWNALVISLLINGLMILLGTLDPSRGYPKILARISDWLSEPPGFLIRLLVNPVGHTGGVFLVGILEAVVISIIVYAAFAWTTLAVWTTVRSRLATHFGTGN